jgi:hypothetical protein
MIWNPRVGRRQETSQQAMALAMIYLEEEKRGRYAGKDTGTKSAKTGNLSRRLFDVPRSNGAHLFLILVAEDSRALGELGGLSAC